MSGAYSMKASGSASVASVLSDFNVSRPKEAISREKALLGAWTVRKATEEGPNGLSNLRRGIYMYDTPTVAEKYTSVGVLNSLLDLPASRSSPGDEQECQRYLGALSGSAKWTLTCPVCIL